jgi:pyruvate,water dikinase
MIPLVLQLREAGDVTVAGGKAANLARLMAAGFPVPPGLVVSTLAFTSHVVDIDLAASDPARIIQSRPIAASLAASIRLAIDPWGERPLAVRSSGVKEDLAGASFAGQYATYLNVSGPDAVLEAIIGCWASAFSPQILAYRSRHGIAAGAMAVLIQPMVAADAAGVAFSLNPVTGNRDEVVVSAVRGLGERLVGGLATPDEWTVREGRAVCRAAPERALDAAGVLGIAELARRVERHFGSPQDIEWAMASGCVHLLQARPITTHAPVARHVPMPVEIPDGFWERDVSHYPLPLYPFERSVATPAQATAFRAVFTEFSLLMDTLDVREIGGWTYQRLVPPGRRDRAAPPTWAWWLLTRLAPPVRARIAGCVSALRRDIGGRFLDQWAKEWKPDLARRSAALRGVDLAALDDTSLVRHLEATHELRRDGFLVHFRLNAAIQLALADFAFTCRDLLDWSEQEALAMLNGLSAATSAPTEALSHLAGIVRTHPDLRRLLDQIDRQTAERMTSLDPAFAEAFAGYQREFGCRTLRYETCDPTVAELPEFTLGLLREQLAQPFDPATRVRALSETREKATAGARRRIAESGGQGFDRFERVLARAEKAYPLREEHGFFDWSAPAAVMRYAALEFGRRLETRGQVNTTDDVFHLELHELVDALQSGTSQLELVDARRGERAWALAQGAPASYGRKPGPPPSFAVLPPEARFVHEALMWTLDRTFAPTASNREQSGQGDIDGIAASAGVFTGPVRVIHDETEFDRIRPGDVLVCPITSPVWTVLFPSVGALVTDSGGILSHSAIIAREYGIPAVVATGNATRLLKDGQFVMVDGNAGVVSVRVATSNTAVA